MDIEELNKLPPVMFEGREVVAKPHSVLRDLRLLASDIPIKDRMDLLEYTTALAFDLLGMNPLQHRQKARDFLESQFGHNKVSRRLLTEDEWARLLTLLWELLDWRLNYIES
jgi:hypothetical protein